MTLGKFAPLHAGHQLVLETALAEMDELVAIVYDCPETTTVPLTVRSDWIRKLYPRIGVIEAWDGPLEIGDTPDIKKRHEDYILHHLGVRGITHFYSSEFYGEHISRALGAVNRIVDDRRQMAPVSGTAVRQAPFACRRYLDPIVYRDLIVNAVFLGAPSTGKTTLASRLAETRGTVWMPEYGREYWEQHQVNRRLTLDQLVEIAEVHLEREEKLLFQADRFLFTDTNAITTYMFSHYYHRAAAPRLAELARRAEKRYDLVFLCDTDIPYENTWDRSGDVNRLVFQKQIKNDLLLRKIPFFTLRGDLEARMKKVENILERFHKYMNVAEIPR